jgi:PST family polysaccharide transporter
VRFLLRVLTQTVNSVVLPTFSRLQTEPERMRRAFYAACRLTSVLSFPAFFGILALAPQTVMVLFGADYLPAANAMRWLAVAGLLQSVSFYNDPVLLATGRATQALRLRAGCSALLIVMVAWGAHYGSFTWVAVAYAANNLLIAVPWLLALGRAIGVRIAEYVPQLSSATLASLLMTGAVLAASRLSLGLGPVLDYTVLVAIGVVTYTAALLAIDHGQVREVLGLVLNRRDARQADSG